MFAVGEETEVVFPQFEVGAHLFDLIEQLALLVSDEMLVVRTGMVADAFAVVVLFGFAGGDFQLLEDAIEECAVFFLYAVFFFDGDMTYLGPAALVVFDGVEVLFFVVAKLVGFYLVEDGGFLGEVVILAGADVLEEFAFLGKEFVAGAAEAVPDFVAHFAAGGAYVFPFGLEL